MHDTFLLNNISKSISEMCVTNNISKIKQLTLVVNKDSHICRDNLTNYLKIHNTDRISNDVEIEIQEDSIESQTAIIKSIKGEKFDKWF